MAKKKSYNILIDMQWSKHYTIKANSAEEAKAKAWERFRKRPPKAIFTFFSERLTD